ncbi:MAG: amino acid adenylation domain-containing protein, partial [bacterium]|nr:amino acid adenylation domain-containing protein [bacterium]
GIQVGGTYQAARDQFEERLVGIWSEVLGVDTTVIGIEDDFFGLGGHSLKATALTSRIHRELNIEIPLAQVFKTPTVKGLTEFSRNIAPDAFIAVEPAERKEYYPLASTQKRFYVIQQMAKDSTGYNMTAVFDVKGGTSSRDGASTPCYGLDKKRLENALLGLIHRHETLRTSFHIIAEDPVQVIHDAESVDFAVQYFDLHETGEEPDGPGESGKGTGNSIEDRVRPIIDKFIRPFDLSVTPLMRAGLIRLDEENYVLLFDMHHIIFDGTSAALFVEEFVLLYGGGELAPLPIQYKDFAQWQSRRLLSDELNPHKEYWLEHFFTPLPVLDIHTDFPRPPARSFAGRRFHIDLDSDLSRDVFLLAGHTGSTLFMILVAVFNILLARYSGQKDIILGSPIAGRNHADLENIVGLLMDTLVLRNFPGMEKTFGDFLNEVKENTLNAYENQDFPFRELLLLVDDEGDLSRNPMFDAMLNVQNQAFMDLDVDGSAFTPRPLESNVSKVDFTIEVFQTGTDLRLELEYCTDLFKRETMERFLCHFINILHDVTVERGADLKLAELEIMDVAEKRRLLEDFNIPHAASAQDTVVPEFFPMPVLFARQVERTPDNIAVTGKSMETGEVVSLTYRQLNDNARTLAARLIKNGITPGSIVAIKVEPSVEMIGGLLGILKSGAAYLPIEPTYPLDRIDYMLADSNVRILITNPGDVSEGSVEAKVPVILSPFQNHEPIGESQEPQVSLNDAVYIIYTSGSTGRPKGVAVEHGNLAAYINAFEMQFHYTPKDTVIQQASYAFDAFAEEIYPLLLRGGKIAVPLKSEVKDVFLLWEYIVTHDVSIIDCSPLLLSRLNRETQERGDAALPIRIFISGGDALKSVYMESLMETGTVYNTYGPTEATICASYYKCGDNPPANVPIGKPIAGYSLYVLNENMGLQPIGVPGELCIAGPGVTRGYLNNPQLTMEKFVTKPLNLRESHESIPKKGAVQLKAFGSAEHFSRKGFCPPEAQLVLYKTGDRVRWLDDGNIEFLGRIDLQVNIRGFRIELEEIENRLLEHGKISEAAVIAKPDNTDELSVYAFIVPTAPGLTEEETNENGTTFELKVSELRQYLSHTLPDYMIPAYFIQPDHMPLLSTGKIDRKALARMEGETVATGTAYAPPTTETEIRLAKIWEDLLKVEKAGINDDFFEIGGDSLKAMSLISRIYKEFDYRIPLAQVFETPTVNGLAKYSRNIAPDIFVAVEPAEKKEYYPLASTQKRFYVIQQMAKDSTGYNITAILDVKGGQPLCNGLDKKRLENTLLKMIHRHETLRTSFDIINEEAGQVIHDADSVDFAVEYYDLRETAIEHNHEPREPGKNTGNSVENRVRTIIEAFIRPFDLTVAPLMRAGLIRLDDENDVLLFDLHHIVFDGTSANLFVKEFVLLYGEGEVAPLAIQYKDFSQWQNRRLLSDELNPQKDYWLKHFYAPLPVLDIRTDYPRPPARSFAGERLHIDLNSDLSRDVYLLADRSSTTLFMILVTVFNILLARYSGQKDIILGSPIAGRNHADLENVIGLLMDTLVLRNFPQSEKTFGDFLSEVKENTLNAYENQDFPFRELLLLVGDEGDLSRNPIFDAMLNVQNMAGVNLDVEGLTFTPRSLESNVSKVDFTIEVFQTGTDLRLEL